MSDISDIPFYPYDGCPISMIYSCVGFDVSVNGMEITLGSGSIVCEEGREFSWSEETFIVSPPASGQGCFGVYAHDNNTYTSGYEPQVAECLITKAIWVYVDESDVSLEGKTIFRNILV